MLLFQCWYIVIRILSHCMYRDTYRIGWQLYRLFVWFDSLRLINKVSVIKGPVFLGWTSTKLGLMFLLKDTAQWRRWGSNPRPLSLETSTLPLSHCAPYSCVVPALERGNFSKEFKPFVKLHGKKMVATIWTCYIQIHVKTGCQFQACTGHHIFYYYYWLLCYCCLANFID